MSFGLVLWSPEFNKSRQYVHGYETYPLGPGNLISSYITEEIEFPFLRIHQYLIVLWARVRPHDLLQSIMAHLWLQWLSCLGISIIFCFCILFCLFWDFCRTWEGMVYMFYFGLSSFLSILWSWNCSEGRGSYCCKTQAWQHDFKYWNTHIVILYLGLGLNTWAWVTSQSTLPWRTLTILQLPLTAYSSPTKGGIMWSFLCPYWHITWYGIMQVLCQQLYWWELMW